MKKALIVAAGLRGIIGHNFFYTQSVREELERRGFEVTVFGNKNAAGDFLEKYHIAPIFSLGTYDFTPQNGALPDSHYTYLQSRIYAYDLQAAMRRINGNDYDLIFCHTVADFELIAWNHYLRKNNLRGHFIVMQRVTPKFSEIPKWKLKFHPYWRIKPYYLNAIRRKLKDRFVLLTDSEVLTKDFAKVYPAKITTAPIPLKGFAPQPFSGVITPDSIYTRHNLQKNGQLDFGFMGDSRNQKGFTLLAPMIEKVFGMNRGNINFIVQCPSSEYEKSLMPAGLAELLTLERKFPSRVQLISERLSDEDYQRLFNFIDAVMIPYTDPQFTEGTSNVFTEAVALGKPIVVSDNTWMSSEMSKYNGGLEFEKGNVEDFAAKVVEMAENHIVFAEKANAYSSHWREFHNAANLVDLLLRQSRLE